VLRKFIDSAYGGGWHVGFPVFFFVVSLKDERKRWFAD
jgi:hypothetical protein